MPLVAGSMLWRRACASLLLENRCAGDWQFFADGNLAAANDIPGDGPAYSPVISKGMALESCAYDLVGTGNQIRRLRNRRLSK